MPHFEDRQPRAFGGRPARNRGLRTYGPPIQPATKQELERQAEAVGVKTGTYIRLVVAEAHDMPWSHLDLKSRLPLPMAVCADDLRTAVAGLERDSVRTGGATTSVRLDPDLARVVERRADEIGTNLGPYIAAVLDIAAGTHPAIAGHQPSLLEDAGPFADRPVSHQEARMAC